MADSEKKPNPKAVPAPDLGYGRWILVDQTTGEILDDAQGYGYKSAAGAHRAYVYKTMPKKKKQQRENIRRQVEQFWEQHHDANDDLDWGMFDALKHPIGGDSVL
ncbi:hypothetical protein [Bifidobacterium sp. SO1]|uniref:hypothetical protein n=1 Tax=Bifidobacterium sp. SO1 TaxID=2809029 RepID=UPI001BDD3EE1|nr:hypothetical protein [Bifidobacterium sp. SO1]MBT1162575.1 hypothetical protein [Bifidobacterium sp. SO1]